MAKYRRVLIKLSGRAMAGEQQIGFHAASVEHIVREVLAVAEEGVEVALVVGGGNFFRGQLAADWGIERAEADQVGAMRDLCHGRQRGTYVAPGTTRKLAVA